MRVRREKEKNTVKEREAHWVTADALGEDGRVAHPQTSDTFDAQPLVDDATDRARRHRVVDRLCLLPDVRDQFRVARFEEVGHGHRGHDGVGEVVFQRLELDQFPDQVETGEEDLREETDSLAEVRESSDVGTLESKFTLTSRSSAR